MLQQYEDGTYGYVGFDNLENEHGKVISEQDMFEEREDYINSCGLTFRRNQYGSNLEFDTQVNDGDYDVRAAVANQGYGLEKLINDERYEVRRAVANQGYGLEKLINDESSIVRAAVAKQGYELEKLVNDEDIWIRDAAREAVFKFEREDIMLKGDRHNNCEDYIKYFISKNNPKAIAKILITQINNNWPCREAVYDLVKEYAEDNNIQPLFKILDVYDEQIIR